MNRAVARFALSFAARLSSKHYVLACWDPEAQVWYVESSSVPGLSLEAANPAALLERLEKAVPELLELNSQNGHLPVPLLTTFEECLQGAA
jgi:hypothetical protein